MLKQPSTYTQQIAKLREHGCAVADEAICEEFLSRVSYYRLTAYPSVEKWNNEFIPSISALFSEYDDIVLLKAIGFPLEWKTIIEKQP